MKAKPEWRLRPGVRVIIKNTPECYGALFATGIPVPKEIMGKEAVIIAKIKNEYQSNKSTWRLDIVGCFYKYYVTADCFEIIK